MSEVIGRLNAAIKAQGPDQLWVDARDALAAAYETIGDLQEGVATWRQRCAEETQAWITATEALDVSASVIDQMTGSQKFFSLLTDSQARASELEVERDAAFESAYNYREASRVAHARLDAIREIADNLWFESKQDSTVVFDAGVAQALVYRLDAALGYTRLGVTFHAE